METVKRKVFHIERVRRHISDLQERTQVLLGWTHDRYCLHQYEQYEAFIARFCEDCPLLVNEVRYSAIFRGFWNKEWAERNGKWHNMARYHEPCDEFIIEEYLYRHSHYVLYNDVHFMARAGSVVEMVLKF